MSHIWLMGVYRADNTIQAVKMSAAFRRFLVMSVISVNLVRNLKGCMGGLAQELLGPHKWFTYQNLQNFTRNV